MSPGGPVTFVCEGPPSPSVSRRFRKCASPVRGRDSVTRAVVRIHPPASPTGRSRSTAARSRSSLIAADAAVTRSGVIGTTEDASVLAVSVGHFQGGVQRLSSPEVGSPKPLDVGRERHPDPLAARLAGPDTVDRLGGPAGKVDQERGVPTVHGPSSPRTMPSGLLSVGGSRGPDRISHLLKLLGAEGLPRSGKLGKGPAGPRKPLHGPTEAFARPLRAPQGPVGLAIDGDRRGDPGPP